ncbi:SixA phosphatase family protein [Yoonia sp. MH D7]
MTRLILIRHGKSSWGDPLQDDHDRVLNPRGRDAATAIGMWLADKGYAPDVMLVSDAQRTVETAKFILAALPSQPDVHYLPQLYHASPDTVLGAVNNHDAQTIAVIGHNPGIGMAASGLVMQAPHHPRFDDYPTCATAVIDFARKPAPNAGHCVDFIVPRDLIGDAGHDAD